LIKLINLKKNGFEHVLWEFKSKISLLKLNIFNISSKSGRIQLHNILNLNQYFSGKIKYGQIRKLAEYLNNL